MVRLEIFKRISKRNHERFGLTEKAAGSLQTDPFANKPLQSTNSRPAYCNANRPANNA